MSNLSVFNFDSNEVRIISDDPLTPWFVAKDVAKALGYRDTVNAIKQHCKGVVNHHPLQTEGGVQRIRVIYEPDVYRLIFGSRLESAQRFQDWVFKEVLPSIRKTRKYEVPPPVPTLTPAQQRHVQERAAAIVNSDDGFTTYRSLYSKIKTRFQVGTYKDIPRSRYPELCRFLHCLPRGELPKSSKSPEPSPEQMFRDLRDGRYLLLVSNGKTTIEDATGKNLVDAKHVHTLRRNCRILTSQMRACFGEAGEETMGIALEDLPTAVER